jgi:hypothetical protein
MELQFDKEIDVILRKARGAAGLNAAGGEHLDADVIAAFVENALPERTRNLYVPHLADCDRCRKLLSQAVALNEGFKPAAPGVTEALGSPIATAIPWYQRLFRAPGLALAMGALVITFGGLLTYMVLVRQAEQQNTAVSQTSDQQVGHGPYDVPVSESSQVANANSAMSAATVTNSTSANISVMGNAARTNSTLAAPEAARPTDETAGVTAKEISPLPMAPRDAKDLNLDTVTPARPPRTAAAAPPPPPGSGDAPVMRMEDKKPADDATRRAVDADLAKRKQDEERGRRDMPAAASKSGPARSGPLGQMNQNQIGEMSVTRSVGGKAFENKNGAWYDRTYQGQATTNYRRGTPEYNALDKRVRSIAESLGGTVVIVWGGKAYRIN